MYNELKSKDETREMYMQDMKKALDEFATVLQFAQIELDVKERECIDKILILRSKHSSVEIEKNDTRILETIRVYNNTKFGVDVTDQMARKYSVKSKCQRWPLQVEAKTGQEEEDSLYIRRAKLYRFTDGEWKERGLGNVKILRHLVTKRLRVLMRRDQVLKICLNHALSEDLEYKRKDDKSWLFAVNDFSEETIELQKFCLRFESKKIAEGSCQNGIGR
ncbi:E3 SUMO-protein ligase RanBP2-like [Glossina fuscipes]|uniref:E3 SUMO-protein ligase RanBP2-like n=1 Tax=Glossina fuscipes TaxID=7396 RepID=A0A9C6E1N7_9MUSC|nr:E3 SUMO-protein ligase RanBP2-like [Glossina fuscipes]